MDVLATTIGGGQSSRLYQVLREEKRLVWTVSASFITQSGSGAFGVFAECPPEKVRSLPNDIYFLFNDVEFNGFKPEEVARAKSQLKSSWLFSQETYHGQASQWGFYTALGAPEMVTEYLKRLEAVNPDGLSKLLSEYTVGRTLAGVIVTPGDPTDK
jgi:predicted Zn-dependent peptidase